MGYSNYKKIKQVKTKFNCRFSSENLFEPYDIHYMVVQQRVQNGSFSNLKTTPFI